MRWADYSAGRPTAAQLKAAGFGGVLRYVAYGRAQKLLTAAEVVELRNGRVELACVIESSTGDAWGTEVDDDYARGVQFGVAGLAHMAQLGVPSWVPLACAADAHAATSQLDDVRRFAAGFASVVAPIRPAGFYGFQETLNAVRGTPGITWFWRCGSQPSAVEKTWTHLWQRNDGTVTIGGVPVDINEQYIPLPTLGGGSASPASSAGPAGKPGGDDMAIIRVPKGGAAGGIAKAVNFPLATSMLFDHDVIIAPGNMPVVLYAAYNWGWSGADDKATPGTGGNPITDPNQPKVIYPRGSYSFIVPAKTGKSDLVYWSDADFTVTIERRA
jgi:hypothetical protein